MEINGQEHQWNAGDLFWVPAGCQVKARALDIHNHGPPVFHVIRFHLVGYDDISAVLSGALHAHAGMDCRIHFRELEHVRLLDRPWADSMTRSALVAIFNRILESGQQQ